jgi:PKD repeat protein
LQIINIFLEKIGNRQIKKGIFISTFIIILFVLKDINIIYSKNDSLVIAVISDTHNGGLNYKYNKDYLNRTQDIRTKFLVENLHNWDFDLFVLCGDFVDDASNSTHLEMFKENFYNPFIEKFKQPLCLVKGNHEIESGDAYDWYNHNNGWYSLDLKGIHLSFYGWGSGDWKNPTFSDKNMTYIMDDLDNTNLSTVVFFHAPMITVKPEWVWNPNQNPLNITQAELIAKNEKVIGFVTGHNHGRGQGLVSEYFNFDTLQDKFTYNSYAISTGHLRVQSNMSIIELGIITIMKDKIIIEGWDFDRKEIVWRDVFDINTTFKKTFEFSPKNPSIKDEIYFYIKNYNSNVSLKKWDFGDGNSSNLIYPTHKYSNPGNYTITLTLENNFGIFNISDNLNVINFKPIAEFSFSPKNVKTGEPVEIINLSIDPEGKEMKYLWYIDNIISSEESNPIFAFDKPGIRTIKLEIIDEFGSKDYAIKKIKIVDNEPPIADFSYYSSQRCEYNITFKDLSRDNDGYIIKWLWNFGDGKNSTSKNPYHMYEKNGKYYPKLTIIDDNGDMNYIIKEININYKEDNIIILLNSIFIIGILIITNKIYNKFN